ncbi:hypothetical protein [Streptomyces sp. SYSU K217416]
MEIKKVSVNGGKAVVLGTSRTESFTISATASDDSGISHSGHRFLGIDREVGDDYWTFHGTPTCTTSSATTSTCKLTVRLEDIDLPRNALAGPWKVNVQLTSKDGDYYGDTYGTHPVQRRSTLSVNASPEPVTKGKTITVTGKLARANWDRYVYAGYTNQSVRLRLGEQLLRVLLGPLRFLRLMLAPAVQHPQRSSLFTARRGPPRPADRPGAPGRHPGARRPGAAAV